MDTGEALLRAVLADKADDLPRLVYADYLEENGDADRAEFIRVQCGYAALCQKARSDGLTDDEEAVQSSLFDRERDLLLTTDVYDRTVHRTCDWLRGFGIDGSECVFNRGGFLHTVLCTLADWCGEIVPVEVTSIHQPQVGVFRPGIGPQVVKRHPVERVVLTDTEPFHGSLGHVWLRGWSTGPLDVGYHHIIPDGVFDLIDAEEREEGYSGRYKSFATRELADKALSDALIKWAESQIT